MNDALKMLIRHYFDKETIFLLEFCIRLLSEMYTTIFPLDMTQTPFAKLKYFDSNLGQNLHYELLWQYDDFQKMARLLKFAYLANNTTLCSWVERERALKIRPVDTLFVAKLSVLFKVDSTGHIDKSNPYTSAVLSWENLSKLIGQIQSD